MEAKKAKLITCHHSGDARILKEIQGSGLIYHKRPNEAQCLVIITQASAQLLKEELFRLGLIISDTLTIERVAKKFALELVKRSGGKLALDEDFGLGLCEITAYV